MCSGAVVHINKHKDVELIILSQILSHYWRHI